MKLVPLDSLFTIEYGNQYDLNKMEIDPKAEINFISRSSSNLGIVGKVRQTDQEPYPAGLMTVTLGGTYLLSAFIQPIPFYTAQNIKVLKPKEPMTFTQKVFYCTAISRNRFRYSSHGREANKSIDSLLLPALETLPNWINSSNVQTEIDPVPLLAKQIEFVAYRWAWFEYQQLFDIERGRGARKNQILGEGTTPLITSIDTNNGVAGFVSEQPQHPGNVITVNRNGSVGEAFYQEHPFCSTEDVHVFIPKFNLNLFMALFLIALIKKERFRYSYGRKWGLDRMKKTKIKLPVDSDNMPDWSFMETFIKTLPYSRHVSFQIK